MGLAFAVSEQHTVDPAYENAGDGGLPPDLDAVLPHLSLGQLIEMAELAQRGGQADRAVALYTCWTQKTRDPQKYLALFNFGSLLQSLGRRDEARSAYEACLALQPQFGQALINLGLLYEASGASAQALRSWSELLAQRYVNAAWDKSLGVVALNHIGRLQEVLRRYDLAEKALQESLLIDPQQPGVLQHWIHVRQKACRWPVYSALPGISMNKMLMCTSPLAQLAVDDDPLKQLLVSSAFVERTYSFRQEHLSKNRRYRHDRIRLGYVSGDLCMHAVGLLMADFLEEHDHSKFELYGYDFSREDGSAHRDRLKQAFEHFRPIGHLSDAQVAQMILADEIDVLIDLHGPSSGARPGIFSLHPAPLQGTYLGFMGTSGMPWLDFVVADRYVLPDELTPYFVEKPLYVDGTYIPLTCQRTPLPALTRAECGLPEQAYVMASFGNVYKINPALFGAWTDLLREIPHSVLWLIDDNPITTQSLRQTAQDAGIDGGRIIFTPRAGYDEYRAKLRLVDVFLDTFPYNCGSTANDVIEAGIPMVTVSGKTMVSRMGGSILTALGQGHLVTQDLETYKQRVIELAQGQTPAPHVPASPAVMLEACKRTVRSFESGLIDLIRERAAAQA